MISSAKILAVLLSFRVFGEDVKFTEDKHVQLVVISNAISGAAETPEEAALLIASGWEETGWSLRIHAGKCRPSECDHGRARGPWQVQRNELPEGTWDKMHGLSNTDVQAKTVVRRLRFWKDRCGSTWGTISRYFGLTCRSESKQVAHRFRTYKEILHALGD